MTAYLSGLMLGLALIVPIGPQNIVVLNQGLLVGFPRSLLAVVFAGICDTLLIVVGAVGVGALFTGIPALRSVLLAVGAVFLLFLTWSAFRRSATEAPAVDDDGPLRHVAMKIAGASLLNPHAILVIGSAIAAQRDDVRMSFAIFRGSTRRGVRALGLRLSSRVRALLLPLLAAKEALQLGGELVA